MTYCYSVYHDNFRDSIGQCTGIHRRITGSSPGRTAVRACQEIGFASLRVLDRLVRLCKPVIKAAIPPFSNENQLRSKTFLISQPNYNKNKRSSQCDYERKSKHSKCSYTCEKRRGLTGISLQSKQIRWGPTPKNRAFRLTAETPCFHFWDNPKPLREERLKRFTHCETGFVLLQ